MKVKKRNGDLVEFDPKKITDAIQKAINATYGKKEGEEKLAAELTHDAIEGINFYRGKSKDPVEVEFIQDMVENAIMDKSYYRLAKNYILYRSRRKDIRDSDPLMKLFGDLTFKDAKEVDAKRENANVNADTSMGTMLKYGSTASNYYVDHYILPPEIAKAHTEGYIHIHDKDFFLLTETCCQIDLLKLFKDGFQSGHGAIREPNGIRTAAALACIAIQANQNEMHGGQAVPHFDYCMAPYVQRTYEKEFEKHIALYKELKGEENEDAIVFAKNKALKATDKATHQAMEALVHNLNTMHSRAGAQVPFSSLNYGTDTSWQGRMVIKNLLLATEEGLGGGETPIFPVQIFKVKEGVNYEEGTPNHDLFLRAIEVSAKRLFPNFSFLDAPFNKEFYKPNDWNSEVAYMGCFQKDQVITYKVNDVLFVESGRRAFDRLSSIFRVQSSGVSEYIDVEKLGVKVYDSAFGGFVIVKKIIRNPEPKNWRLVKLSSGRSIVVTDDHYLPVNGKGRVRVSDLEIGDEVPCVWSQYTENDIPYDNSKAWLLGMILCDGAYATGIVVSVGADELELAMKIEFVCKNLGFDVVRTKQIRGEKGSYYDVRINTGSFKESKAKLTALFGGEKKADRHIPNQVFSWEEGAKMAFLAGMFDADGYVDVSHDKSFALTLGSTNEELAIQQMLLFQALGVRARIYRNHYKACNAGAIRYAVYAYPDETFLKKFSVFVSCNKKYKKILNLKPSAVIDDNFICKVESINTYVEHDFCYDLETVSDRFDVSGICSHNCRTRVMANRDKDKEVTCGRGNLSFTSINLPRLAIEAKGNKEQFFKDLGYMVSLVFEQLMHRFKIQGKRKVRNYPFLMGNGIWLDSDKLDWDDEIAPVLRHGTLTLGFIGLAEALIVLTGKHHGESEEAQELGLEIVRYLRDRCDGASMHYDLNFSLIGTPAEGLSGRFVALDKKKFGVIEGVTDKEYYTNSFHIPVYYKIKAHKKIELEAPYHEFTNGGHITYVELDGNTANNTRACLKIIQYMHDKGIGYGSFNHPVDRDPLCGYVGVIGDVCPRCGRHEGEGIPLEKLEELRRKYPNVPR